MTRKLGIVLLFGLAGSWLFGCAPASQMVKSEMPEATPTPTAAMTAATTPTPTLTETPVSVPARPAGLRTHHSRGARVHQAAAKSMPAENAGEVSPPVPLSVAVQAATVSAANSMATASAAIAAATVAAALPAAAAGQAAGNAPGLAWTPTPVVDYSQAGTAHAPVRLGKLFMGLGLLILFGGILYALRQLQESRRTSRRAQVATRAQAEETRGEAHVQPHPQVAHPAPASRAAEHEPALGHAHPAAAAESRAESAAAAVHAKSAPRRRKTAGTPKTPKKAALRASRPAVKTVRLGKRAKTASRPRRKTA